MTIPDPPEVVAAFTITQDEYNTYLEWLNKIKADGYSGAIGGDITFHFTPTSIGDIVEVSTRRVKMDSKGRPIRKRNGKRGQIRYKYKTLKLVLRELK